MKTFSTILFMLIIYFALEGVISIGDAIKYRNDTEWNMSSYQESIETVKNEIPKETLGIGVGELYYDLGWENMVYTMDYADNNAFGISTMEAEAQKADTVLVNSEVLVYDELPFLNEQFHIVKNLELPEFNLLLYERNQ